MKKSPAKVYKILAFILGGVGGVGSLVVAYLRSASIIASSNLSEFKSVSFFKNLLLYWFCVFVICLLLYAAGYIMEQLQSINQELSDK